MSSLTQLVCTLGASAADMAQHLKVKLVQPTSPSHHSNIKVLIRLRGLVKEMA
jgi:hypothetical protein